jgi:hypothetical protein
MREKERKIPKWAGYGSRVCRTIEDRIYLHIEIIFSRHHGMGKSGLYARIGEEGKGKGGLLTGAKLFIFVFAGQEG